MNTFLYNPLTDTLVRRDSTNTDFAPLVKIADPVSIEYKHVFLKIGTPSNSQSTHHMLSRDFLFSSFVRNRVSKDRSLETVIYYDQAYHVDSEKIPGSGTGTYQKLYETGPFDASEYGCPVCMYTPGYEGSAITITTKLYEIRKTLVDVLKTATSFVQSAVSAATAATTIPVLNFASPLINSAIGIGGALLTELVDEKHLLVQPQTIAFEYGNTREPFCSGTYVVFLGNVVNVSNIGLQGTSLLIDKETLLPYREQSYFILEIDTTQRNDLRDFDFTSSCAEQLVPIASLLNNNDNITKKDLFEQIVNVKKDAYDLLLFEAIQSALSHNNSLLAKALYQQLQASNPDRAAWLSEHCSLGSSITTFTTAT